MSINDDKNMLISKTSAKKILNCLVPRIKKVVYEKVSVNHRNLSNCKVNESKMSEKKFHVDRILFYS